MDARHDRGACRPVLYPRSHTQPPGKDWPLVLDVHKQCDERAKREADQLTKVVHVLNTRGAAALAPDERGVVRNTCTVGEAPAGAGEQAPVLGGIDRVMRNVFLWARGFYAALYGVVPPAGVRQTTRAPAPGFDSSRADVPEQLRRQERSTEAILVLLFRASARGLSDRVVLLGGNIVFECAWFQRREGGPWMCHWALDIPGSTKWAIETQGRDVPWHGAYELPHKPERAVAAPLAELCKAT